MSFGFFIWLVVAIGIGGFTWWSIRVQMMQKKAWKAFANKFGLLYEGNQFFERPSIEGNFEGVYFRLFEGDEFDRGGRVKKAIIIEAELGHVLPFNLIITKKSEQAVFKYLSGDINVPKKPNIKSKVWDPGNILATDDEDSVTRWLNIDRLAALQKSLSIPNSKPVFLSDSDIALLALQLENPMLDPKLLYKLFKRLRDTISVLRLEGLVADDPEEGADEEDVIDYDKIAEEDNKATNQS